MNSKTTKRALLGSFTSLLLCFAMLIGSTFAWFTDTATTSVNTIQAGTLDVALEMWDSTANEGQGGWVDAEGATLSWQKAAGHESEDILWEPGCTYNLQKLRVRNAGNLALKYKMAITGIGGDAELNDVIDWKVIWEDTTTTVGPGATYDLDTWLSAPLDETELVPADANTKLYAKDCVFTIQGHMDENAGNYYQGMSIDNIAITILATQYRWENDSTGTAYDDNATYPEAKSGASLTDVFEGVTFDFDNPATDVNIDGQGVATVTDYTDAWFNGDVTIKGVKFMNGACFTAKNGTEGTITFENCTFYACDQSKIDLTPYSGNSLKNSGDGLCLNVDTGNSPKLEVVIKNCTFIGENDNTLDREGWKNLGGNSVDMQKKARGHAIALNAFSGAGSGQIAKSATIEGCTISGIRGNAIQLYTLRYPVTIKNCEINSWGMNKQTAAGEKSDSAIRGDLGTDGSLTLENNYFGLDEKTNNILHVNVNDYTGNTDGTRVAGTY